MILHVSWTISGDGKPNPHLEATLSEAEAALVGRLVEREESALLEVLTDHQSRIFNLALRITGSVEDAEEVTQDTFLRMLDKVQQFEGRASLGTWLYRVGTNQALMKRRSTGRRQEQSWDDPMAAFTEDGLHATPIRKWRGSVLDIQKEETARIVRQAVDDLPEDYRNVIVLADLEGRSRQEIAEILEISVPAVKSRLHRARLALRTKLAAEFEEAKE
ncbi:RNA polymerase sigma factor [bacterium]|nr:RNA polymerase sigma factor [bacterium]